MKRDPAERYYGFGEKSGDADKHGRRLRMGTADALGYDAGTSDPLYKHIPFYLTVRPDHGGAAVGLFYDNLARGALTWDRRSMPITALTGVSKPRTAISISM